MKLTEEQLKQIDNYIQVSGIKYYDVRMEIVDHFANILEERLDENPGLDFRQELENIHKGFSDAGFSRLLKEKTKAVNKRFINESLNHFISFFTIPKVLITVLLFLIFRKLLEFFKNPENFFLILLGIGVIMCASIVVRPLWKNSQRDRFLSLDMTINFLQVFNFLVAVLQSFNNRGIDSLNNEVTSNILIAGYVLLYLFFWSGQYVYHQNKKLLKEQYPNVLV